MTLYSDAFGQFYDRYFTGWIREFTPDLVSYLDETQVADKSILDLCCGTGISALLFCQAGWKVTGLDIAPGMLHIGKQRLQEMIVNRRANLCEGNAECFDLPEKVGACICLDGALNHLESTASLQSCFASVSRALQPGGQFMFDLFEPTHFQHWHKIVVMEEPDATMVKRGVWSDQLQRGMLRVSGSINLGEKFVRVEQTLSSRTFTQDEVKDALAAAGLVMVPSQLQSRSAGMRPEATESDLPIRTLYRALKPQPAEVVGATSSMAPVSVSLG